ncbi:WD40 repeat domain-containing protein [Nocardiopsis sp. MG754419]|uniref:WD40 repeat domain-containing protein n=1 Tax=Nocardiopsis sp. MG754419 TaxID=2259865 RepID=UPI002010FA8F|nr:hypothetical protein [Nocardiopsis sp. MG754419]
MIAHDRLSGDPGATEDDAVSLISEGDCGDATGYPAPEEPPAQDTTVSELTFSADGNVLAVSSQVGLMVWDWREKEEIARPAEALSALRPETVFSPFGCTLIASSPVAYETRENPVQMAHTHDLLTGTTVRHLGAQEGPDEQDRWLGSPKDIQNFDFSPDGTRMVLALDTGFTDGAGTQVIDTATGEAGEALTDQRQYRTRFLDEDHIATNDHGSVHVWDVDSGERVRTVEGTASSWFTVRPGGTEVAFEDTTGLSLVDHGTGEEVASFARDEFETDDDPALTQLRFDPAGELLYAAWMVDTDQGGWRYHSYLWDVASGENLWEDAEHDTRYRTLAFHPDGEVVAAITTDPSPPVLLDPDTYEQVGTLY